jgi:hypothetical protein
LPSVQAWGDMGFANIYNSIAQRAIDPALPGIKNKTSLAVSRSMACQLAHA